MYMDVLYAGFAGAKTSACTWHFFHTKTALTTFLAVGCSEF
jgi:hypothetical protein